MMNRRKRRRRTHVDYQALDGGGAGSEHSSGEGGFTEFEPKHLCARLQQLAENNSDAVSAATQAVLNSSGLHASSDSGSLTRPVLIKQDGSLRVYLANVPKGHELTAALQKTMPKVIYRRSVNCRALAVVPCM